MKEEIAGKEEMEKQEEISVDLEENDLITEAHLGLRRVLKEENEQDKKSGLKPLFFYYD